MTGRDAPRTGLATRLVAIAATVALLTAGLAGLARLTSRSPRPRDDGAPAPLLHSPPIDAEARVFRAVLSDVAVPPWVARRATAHPRTLATARALRAYPGAPPRIPHGLTRDEFRDVRCLTCHERGGFSQRFGAYAPVTPHPEFGACLQCHAANDVVVGVRLPDASPDATCRQCHAPGVVPAALPADGARVRTQWPPLAATSDTPPAIPHDLQLRGNCLACHVGPAAVAEIRTSHAERTNCRQCHVTAGDASTEWVRPGDAERPARGRTP